VNFRFAEKEYTQALQDNGLVASYKPSLILPKECFSPLPERRKTNIILLPGFNSDNNEWDIFGDALKPWGRQVMRAQVDVKLSNAALADNLFQWLKGEGLLSSVPLTLIGFSNGGLICRAVLHKYGIMNIKRVIMIATPNWGTTLAVFGKLFISHPGLKDLKVGSEFLNWLNSNYRAARMIPHYVIVGDAARDLHGERFDAVVWENSATMGYMLPYVRVNSGEAVRLYRPNSAWHLNLTRKSRCNFGPSNDRVWPITLDYVRCFLAQ
jgi:pimeloyl-ACP methyl ester carboxylesterase